MDQVISFPGSDWPLMLSPAIPKPDTVLTPPLRGDKAGRAPFYLPDVKLSGCGRGLLEGHHSGPWLSWGRLPPAPGTAGRCSLWVRTAVSLRSGPSSHGENMAMAASSARIRTGRHVLQVSQTSTTCIPCRGETKPCRAGRDLGGPATPCGSWKRGHVI